MIIKLFLWDYGRSRILLLLRPLAIKCPEIWLWIILQGPRLMIRVQKADLKVLRKFWHEVFVHLLMICYSLLCIPHLTLVPGHCHSCAQVWRFRSRWDRSADSPCQHEAATGPADSTVFWVFQFLWLLGEMPVFGSKTKEPGFKTATSPRPEARGQNWHAFQSILMGLWVPACFYFPPPSQLPALWSPSSKSATDA